MLLGQLVSHLERKGEFIPHIIQQGIVKWTKYLNLKYEANGVCRKHKFFLWIYKRKPLKQNLEVIKLLINLTTFKTHKQKINFKHWKKFAIFIKEKWPHFLKYN